MKTYTTRDDLIQMRGQTDQELTKMELDGETKRREIFVFRALYAILDFLIRKTWGL